MLGSSRARRAVTGVFAAAAIASLGAATADAKVVTVTDDAAADFALGTQSSTAVRGDAVELARTMEEQFDGGPTLPAAWTSTPWEDPLGTSTVQSGSLVVDGARADSHVPTGPGSALEFRGTLGSQTFSHVGFGIDFDEDPSWAMFSTGPDGAGKVYARVSSAPGSADDLDFPVPGVDALIPHDYRIAWTTTGFDFYVDGALVVTHAVPFVVEMRPQASNFVTGGGDVSVDSMVLRTHKSGTFTSRKINADDARVTGLSFTATSDVPDGSAIAYETRTAETSDGLDAAAWAPLGAGGTVASAPEQYLQYRATLTTPDPAVTPSLNKVVAVFTVDDEAPNVAIEDVAVSGNKAKVTFSADASATDVECNLDGGAFAACDSPEEFNGLVAGTHTVVVQAADAVGNVGSATRSFEIAKPPVSGGNGSGTGTDTASRPPASTPPAADTAADLTAPNVLVMGKSLRVSKRGVARLRVRCPRSEASCEVAVKLTVRGKRVARKRLTLSGGATQTFRLRLSKAARKSLAKRSRLAAKAVVTAEDTAANRRTTTRRVTLRG